VSIADPGQLANMADYVGPNFEMREISEMNRETAALAEITVETFMDGRGDPPQALHRQARAYREGRQASVPDRTRDQSVRSAQARRRFRPRRAIAA
jgi:hypothetical protein